MFKIDSGGPAFPRTGFYPETNYADIEHIRELIPTVTEPQAGMSLMDYYIGQALQGILANSGTFGRGLPPMDRAEAQELVKQISGSAVIYAHALMEAREEYLKLPRKPRPHNPEEDT